MFIDGDAICRRRRRGIAQGSRSMFAWCTSSAPCCPDLSPLESARRTVGRRRQGVGTSGDREVIALACDAPPWRCAALTSSLNLAAPTSCCIFWGPKGAGSGRGPGFNLERERERERERETGDCSATAPSRHLQERGARPQERLALGLFGATLARLVATPSAREAPAEEEEEAKRASAGGGRILPLREGFFAAPSPRH